jgi:3'(2'), 5'-bisphosphate nucleotidase
MLPNDPDLLHLAVEAALEAGREIMEIYESGDFDVQVKGDESPLTRADVASHRAIVKRLEPTGIPVLSEEGRAIPHEERRHWPSLWIVDPIDGTKEFIKRNGEFTVNIALVEGGTPVLGVVFVPAKQELFVGDSRGDARALRTVQGRDDWSVDHWLDAAAPIPAESEGRPFTVVASRSHMSPETADYIDALRSEYDDLETLSKGSSLKLCMVASGEADCYPRFAPTMEWDTAAGQAVCLAAGCDVLNWKTKQPLAYNREDLLNPWFLVRGPRMLQS